MAATSIPSASTDRWFFGPWQDLIFGCGLVYLLALPMLLFWDEKLPITAIAFVNLFVAAPHYGATLLRTCQRRESRSVYGRFALATSVVIAACFVLGLSSAWLGSLLITLYVSWSPWHYSGQHYGISLMFMRRRGVQISDGQKKLLYTSFWLSFLPALLVIHSAVPGVDYALLYSQMTTAYGVIPLGIPRDLGYQLIAIAALGYVGTLIVLARSLLRTNRLADLGPACLVVALQSIWFAMPGFLLTLGYDRYQSVAFSVVVTTAVHSIQYLWITSYYARRESGQRLLPYLTKAMLAATGTLGATTILFSPILLGSVPYDSGLALLVVAVLNLHHFVLDGAIWKLRDGRIARFLLGRKEDASTTNELVTPGWPAVLRRLAWTAASVFVLLELVYVHDKLTLRDANTPEASSAMERMAAIGRDSAWSRGQLAAKLATVGNHKRALEEIDQSLQISAEPKVLMLKAHIHEKDRNWRAAVEAYDAALALDPSLQEARVKRARTLERAI